MKGYDDVTKMQKSFVRLTKHPLMIGTNWCKQRLITHINCAGCSNESQCRIWILIMQEASRCSMQGEVFTVDDMIKIINRKKGS